MQGITVPNKPLNKMQIETAQEVLIKTINRKRDEIGEAAFKADIQKNKTAIIAFNKKALELRQEALKLKATVEKGTKLKLDMDGYNSYIPKLPHTLDDVENNSVVSVKGSSYNDKFGDYRPELKKEALEIERFILGLKLGTALLSDLDALVEKIAKAK